MRFSVSPLYTLDRQSSSEWKNMHFTDAKGFQRQQSTTIPALAPIMCLQRFCWATVKASMEFCL